ncbi:hypothetical protein FisN_17Lh071 [Fistulifera solaris]|uniref:Cytidyltransferase-like domain-containing protein n=1 Tax=Fistulifera solaris TaxID=1519565 RepID=A0A1Z5K271_FISSO|nr:hypothetical protein FisN_17Lh071 [Fistulifera solaris]|eukprot:GAX20118.1 hypothetical protein FisN_17Lh071 [Fistulifera solaris]
MRHIALYGLSADPPTGHGGHVGIVQALVDLFDEVHILPVYRHTYQDKRQRLVSFEHRWNMCHRAFADLSPKVVVSDAEYQSWRHAVAGLSEEEAAQVSVGTAALMEYYQSLDNSSVEYYFCLGADAFLDLLAGKWKESQRVLGLLQGRFVVFHRHSADIAMLQEKVQQMPGAQLLEVESLTNVSSSQEHKLYQFDDTR